jgi:hypothetical protein
VGPQPRGISKHKADPALCMVTECPRKALYRANKKSKRGYCSEHKDLAVSFNAANKSNRRWLDERVTRQGW